MAEEQELRDLFERFGRVTRVFLARDRDTQKAKGFAFISFADRNDAARACEKMDGCKCSLNSIHECRSYADINSCSRLPPPHSARGIRQEDFLKESSSLLQKFLLPFLFFLLLRIVTWCFRGGRAHRLIRRGLFHFISG